MQSPTTKVPQNPTLILFSKVATLLILFTQTQHYQGSQQSKTTNNVHSQSIPMFPTVQQSLQPTSQHVSHSPLLLICLRVQHYQWSPHPYTTHDIHNPTIPMIPTNQTTNDPHTPTLLMVSTPKHYQWSSQPNTTNDPHTATLPMMPTT